MRKKPMPGQPAAGPIEDREAAGEAANLPDAVEVQQTDGRGSMETEAGTPSAGRSTELPTEFILVRAGKAPGILSGPVRPVRKETRDH